MKKRIFGLLLVLVMVAALLPTFTLTAEAYDYRPGDVDPVFTRDLEEGDVIREGVTLKSAYASTYLRKVTSPTDTRGDSIITEIRIGDTWPADTNYYVTKDGVYNVYLYPIPDSPVTFWPNGGSIRDGTTGAYTTGASTLQCLRFTGDHYSVGGLTPSRYGYNFLGWYTADGATQIYNANGRMVNDGTLWKNGLYQGEGPKDLIAKWQAIPYITFRYHPNGGNQPDNYKTWDAFSTDPFPDSHWNYANSGDTCYMTRTGYTATGYYAKADGSCSVHQDYNFTSYADLCSKYGVSTGTAHTTIDIYAQWKANTYTVSFNGNGATGGSTATQNFTYDVAQNLRANGFQQAYTVTFDPGEGLNSSSATATSTFKGWNTAANGSGTAYSNQQSVKNLTATSGGNITLYAQWTKGSVTLPTPTKTGMVCTGWYTSSGTKVGDCGASYTPTGNTALYAKWETVGYTVTWKNHDGTTLETDEGVAQGATPTYDGATPTKPDTTEKSYIFSGWSPAISPVTGDVAYIAQFTETPRQYALGFAFDNSKGKLGGNEKAAAGSVVTVNVLPNNGYGVKDIIAYKTGDKNTTVSIDPTSYTFTMPAFDVTIEVTWKESDVIYTSAYKDVAPTFTVTIPATVELGNQITVSAENVRVNKGSEVVISIADASGIGNPFTMTGTAGDSFTYSITANGNAISSGADVLTVNPDTASAGTVTLKFEKPKKAIYAGNYTGSVTFTIAVNPAENN